MPPLSSHPYPHHVCLLPMHPCHTVQGKMGDRALRERPLTDKEKQEKADKKKRKAAEKQVCALAVWMGSVGMAEDMRKRAQRVRNA